MSVAGVPAGAARRDRTATGPAAEGRCGDGQDEADGGQQRAERRPRRSSRSRSLPYPHVARLQTGHSRAGPRMAVAGGVRTMVRGSGWGGHRRGRRCRCRPLVRPVNAVVGSVRGPVRSLGRQAQPAYPTRGIRTVRAESPPYPHAPPHGGRSGPERPGLRHGRHVGRLLLVIGGLWLAYVAWSTPSALGHRGCASGPARACRTPGCRSSRSPSRSPRPSSWSAPTAWPGPSPPIEARGTGRGDRLSRILPDDVVLARGVTSTTAAWPRRCSSAPSDWPPCRSQGS